MLVALAFTACSLDAQETENRGLADPALREYIAANLGRKHAPGPPWNLDLRTLTLVALFYHPDLVAARARVAVAQADVITAETRSNPSFAAAPQFVGGATAGTFPWVLTFDLDIPIETAGKRGYRLAEAKQLSEAARLDVAEMIWRIRSRVRASLVDLFAAQRTAAKLGEQLTAQEELAEALQKQITAGEIAAPIVTQARIQLDQTLLGLQDAQRQIAEAHVTLADSLGLPTEALDGANLVFGSLDHVPCVNVAPSELLAQARLNRPDILKAHAEIAASKAAVRLEGARRYPDVHLVPSYERDQDQNKYSLGFSVELPIFNRNQGPIAAAEAGRQESVAKLVALQAQVRNEIARAFAGFDGALKKLNIARQLLDNGEKQLRSAQADFENGATDRVAFLQAKVELCTLEQAWLDALVKSQQALGALEDAAHSPLDGSVPFSKGPETKPKK